MNAQNSRFTYYYENDLRPIFTRSRKPEIVRWAFKETTEKGMIAVIW